MAILYDELAVGSKSDSPMKKKPENPMEALLDAIVQDDHEKCRTLLRRDPTLATSRVTTEKLYESGISHWLYEGDTALHLAAAGHRAGIVKIFLEAGALPDDAGNRRASTPLHYASDGLVTSAFWNESKQQETIRLLVRAGASIHAQDKNGASPLHRAVRTRCAKAVQTLLQLGADPKMKNKSGSTPFHLAVQNTGRGGSGATIAHEAQREIIQIFLSAGVSPQLRDGNGKTILEAAQSNSMREWLGALLKP